MTRLAETKIACEHEATARGLAWLLCESREGWAESEGARRFPPASDALLEVRFRRWRAEMERALRREP